MSVADSIADDLCSRVPRDLQRIVAVEDLDYNGCSFTLAPRDWHAELGQEAFEDSLRETNRKDLRRGAVIWRSMGQNRPRSPRHSRCKLAPAIFARDANSGPAGTCGILTERTCTDRPEELRCPTNLASSEIFKCCTMGLGLWISRDEALDGAVHRVPILNNKPDIARTTLEGERDLQDGSTRDPAGALQSTPRAGPFERHTPCYPDMEAFFNRSRRKMNTLMALWLGDALRNCMPPPSVVRYTPRCAVHR